MSVYILEYFSLEYFEFVEIIFLTKMLLVLHAKKRVLNTRGFQILPRIKEYDLSWRTYTARATAHR